MRRAASLFLLAVVLAPPIDARAEEPKIVRAAPLRGDPEWPPRRLFNAGLDAEQRGNITQAVQLYMSARLAARGSFADELYARGAALRLVRLLSTYDEDAAAAAAMLVAQEAGDRATTDLAPLIRTLLRRFDRGDDIQMLRGSLASLRVANNGRALLEIKTEDDDRRIVAADGPVGPFSAGDPVRLLVRREGARASASWRVIAMSHAKADGWQLLAVSDLPGQPGPAYGALVGHETQIPLPIRSLPGSNAVPAAR